MTKSTSEADDILTVVAQEIAAAHIAGIPALDMPNYVADRIRQRAQGCYQYVRKNRLSPRQRADDIRQRFNGKNEKELAVEHGITVRRVEQIVKAK